jgi:hypothetical protein
MSGPFCETCAHFHHGALMHPDLGECGDPTKIQGLPLDQEPGVRPCQGAKARGRSIRTRHQCFERTSSNELPGRKCSRSTSA